MTATPEQKAFVARRTLVNATTALCLCALGCGVTRDRLKSLILFMRSPEIAVLTNDEALAIIHRMNLGDA